MDIRTLAIILGITNLLQVIAIFIQYRVNKAYRGIGWWVFGFASVALGFVFMILRDIVPVPPIAIISGNALTVLGSIFLYIGVMRFLDRKENRGVVISIFAVFLLLFLYFMLVTNDITARTVIVSATLATISFFIAQSLFVHKIRAIAASANFISAVFFAHGCYFAVRSVATLTIFPIGNFFTPTFFQVTAYLDPLIAGILSAFGFIIMVNQRLNADSREAMEHFELIFNTSPDASLINRLTDGAIVNINDGFTALTGFTREETLGKSALDIHIWKDPADRQKVVDELRERGYCENFEAVFRRKDGSQIIGMMSAKMLTLQGNPHVISVTRDITERKRMENALRESERRYCELSIVDDLTQLHNSRHFYHQLKMEIDRSDRYGQPLTLLLLDLDDFKQFNDTYGHIEGDQVLFRLGQVVKRCLRQTDSAYRYGGEEFTILLPMTSSADAVVTAERIRTGFKKETFSPVPGLDIHVTVSIGLAQYEPKEEMKTFVQRVDQLMYQGKKNGKDRVCSKNVPDEPVNSFP